MKLHPLYYNIICKIYEANYRLSNSLLEKPFDQCFLRNYIAYLCFSNNTKNEKVNGVIVRIAVEEVFLQKTCIRVLVCKYDDLIMPY